MDRRFYNVKKDSSVLYLYNNGDECIDITGGWKEARKSGAGLVKYDTYMDLSFRYSSNNHSRICTNNSIDLSAYDYLVFEASNIDGSTSSNFAPMISKTNSGEIELQVLEYDATYAKYPDKSIVKMSLKPESKAIPYYPGMRAFYGLSSYGTLRITKIYLTKE